MKTSLGYCSPSLGACCQKVIT